MLSPVAKLAERYGPAVVVMAHRRKSGGSHADDLAIGSRAFTGIARAVWHLSRDTENKSRRLLLAGKNNLAPEGDGLAFTIGGQPPLIMWERDPVKMSANDALDLENEGPGKPATDRRGSRRMVAGGAGGHGGASRRGAAKAAGEAGLAWRTVQGAKKELDVIVERAGFGGGYIWRLSRPGTTPDEQPEVPADGNLEARPEVRATNGCQNPLPSIILTSGTHGENQGKTCQNHHECHNSNTTRMRTLFAPRVRTGWKRGSYDRPNPADHTPRAWRQPDRRGRPFVVHGAEGGVDT